MAIAYTSSTSFSEGNGSSVATVSKPASTAVGDLLVAQLYIENAGESPTIASTGDTWTLVHSINNPTTTPDTWIHVWVCVVANASSTIGVTWGGGSFWRDFAVHRFTGVDTTTPQDVAATENQGDSTTPTGLGLASGTAGRHLVLLVNNFDGDTSASWTSPLTERNDSGNVAMASGEDAAGTDTANKTAAITPSTNWCTVLLALRPVDEGGAEERGLDGAQPAATGALARLLAALRGLAGSQPAGTAALTRLLAAPRALAGAQPAAAATLTRLLAAPRSLAGAQPAASGALGAGRGAYAAAVLADGPVAYWRLNEGAGTLAADSSGGGVDGTYTGGFTLGATGALNDGTGDDATALDGSTGYVALPADALLNDTGPITIECWVKTTSTDAHDNLFGGYQDGGDFLGYGFRLNNGVPGYYSSATEVWVEATSGGVNDGEWHHVAVSVTGTTASFYIDGAAAGTPTSAQPGSYSGVRAIGARAGGAAEWLAGTLDEVALYSTALSGARILAHYEAGVGDVGESRDLAGAQPTATGVLARLAQTSRALAGAQPAATGALTRLKAALRSLTGTQPTATGALSRLLAALRSLSGDWPTAAGALTRSKANARSLAGSQPAATGTLAGQQTVSRSVAGGQPTATGALTRVVVRVRSLAGNWPTATGVLARLLALLRSLAGEQPAPTGALSRQADTSQALAGALPAPEGTLTRHAETAVALAGAQPSPTGALTYFEGETDVPGHLTLGESLVAEALLGDALADGVAAGEASLDTGTVAAGAAQ